MLNTKIFEVRDRMTYIPVLATRLRPTTEWERRTIWRAGYDPNRPLDYIIFSRLGGDEQKQQCDPCGWGESSRTMFRAHRYVEENWDTLDSGDVIDIEHIMGETTQPKKSEVYES